MTDRIILIEAIPTAGGFTFMVKVEINGQPAVAAMVAEELIDFKKFQTAVLHNAGQIFRHNGDDWTYTLTLADWKREPQPPQEDLLQWLQNRYGNG